VSEAIEINERTELPRLFRTWPETRAVFNRYGLRGCGGEQGPAETVGFFAGTHGVELGQLIDQVRQVIRDPLAREQARAQLADDARPRLADAIYRPFFLAGLVVILTVGAAWGVLLLWKIGFDGSFTGVSVHEVNAHGHAQIMGWVGLFIMGFAYQAFPRMWQVDLPAPRLALVSWLAMLVGIACRSTAMMARDAAWAAPVHHVGLAVEVLAVAIFVALLVTAFRRSGQPFQPYVAFAFAALAFFVIQTVYSGWHIARLLAAPDRDTLLAQIATFQAPLRDIQIHGLAMLMIFAVSIRMFPAIFGLGEVSSRRAWAAYGLLLAAIAMETSLFLTFRLTGAHAAAGAMLLPWLLLPIGAGLIVGPWKLWRPLPEPGRSDRSGKFMRLAFVWLFVSFAMLLLLPVYQLISGIPFSHAYYGAVRHAITVGFISMMIVGVAAKVVPMLRGVGPGSGMLPALWLPFLLINLGCLLRVGFQIGTDWHPLFFKLVGVSGMLEWTGLAIWAAHLAAVMLGLGRYRAASAANWGPTPERIEPDHRVAAVLHWHPELESIFLDHGFDLIRNPVLRRTLARQVTLRQACRMKGVARDAFLAALNGGREGGGQVSGAPQPSPLTIEGEPQPAASSEGALTT
jgi:hypothetical protein